jgi:hypothetical protein
VRTRRGYQTRPNLNFWFACDPPAIASKGFDKADFRILIRGWFRFAGRSSAGWNAWLLRRGRGFESRRSRQYSPLLLTLLSTGEFLYNLTAFPGFKLFARIFHEFGEPAGQFVNALRLPSFNRLGWNQFRADTDGGCT